MNSGLVITPASAASLADLDVRQARAALIELARAHLIEEQAPGRFALYDLLRAYAIERASADTDDRGPRRATSNGPTDQHLMSA
jgi:hypothetical protein